MNGGNQNELGLNVAGEARAQFPPVRIVNLFGTAFQASNA